MLMRLIIMTLFIMISSQVFAGTGYEVTVETDEETKSYMVIFGGGRYLQNIFTLYLEVEDICRIYS